MAAAPGPIEMNVRVQPVLRPETAAALHKLIDSVETALADARTVIDSITGEKEGDNLMEHVVTVESPSVTVKTSYLGTSEPQHPWTPGQPDRQR